METNIETTEDQKNKARKEYKAALKSGTLVRPQSCSNCGTIAEIHGHHHDYSKPLAVVWLCGPCHALVHKALNGCKPKLNRPGRPRGSNGEPRPKTALTRRELEVLRLVCDGKMNREIGVLLKISQRTAETHRERIYKFAKTHNTAQLVRWAMSNHLIALQDSFQPVSGMNPTK